MSRKVFVGSLPNAIDDATLRSYFSPYGQVTDVFIKPNCEAGRQWAFVTFATTEQAQSAKESCDRKLHIPGAEKPCDVMLAKNQGMFGQAADVGVGVAPAVVNDGPKKIFVGSLPDGCTEDLLRMEFAKYGVITDVFMKTGCEPGRQWAFITYTTGTEAALAKSSTDRILMLPGSIKACEVTLARNQGMFGQDNLAGQAGALGSVVPAANRGPCKIFVGSLPDGSNDALLRQEFDRFGQITEVFVKQGCEPGRQWAFVTFATPEQAQLAKDSTDRLLMFPGAEKACEVMLAKNQGKFGQEPMGGAAPAATPLGYAALPAAVAAAAVPGGFQPPPPTAPAPAHMTQWRCYYTAAGLPYYHNHLTGVTQWEAPPELSVPGATAAVTAAAAGIPAMGALAPTAGVAMPFGVPGVAMPTSTMGYAPY